MAQPHRYGQQHPVGRYDALEIQAPNPTDGRFGSLVESLFG